MSDTLPTVAPVSSVSSVTPDSSVSAPEPVATDTHSIVTQAVEDANQESASDDTSSPSSTDGSSEPATPPVGGSDTVGLSEADKILSDAGISPLDQRKRENRIPYSRVKKIVENAERKLSESHATALKDHTSRIADYEQRLERIAEVEQVMFNEPEKFLNEVLSQIPAYSKILGDRNPSTTRRDSPSQADFPQPDVRFPDGTVTYSQEGLSKLLEWQSAQTEQRVAQRFAPIEERYKQEQQLAAAIPVIENKIAEARTWTLFNESEREILAVLQADKKISLEAAYQKVVFPKLQADRNKIREEVLKELNAKPRSTATVAATPVVHAEEEASGGTAALVRAAVAKLSNS